MNSTFPYLPTTYPSDSLDIVNDIIYYKSITISIDIIIFFLHIILWVQLYISIINNTITFEIYLKFETHTNYGQRGKRT